MSLAVLAVIWHYWIGVVLFGSLLLVIGAVVAGYFAKVVRPKYPPKR
ncbi:MAG: hypothetical protein M3527_05850 [Actinomycetota bacterium]|nr:hypothetical protein [Acidimicrobiia bacterium]MDQ3293954.1 hypothetical protein [Actinomycetota bacterium]